MNKPNAARVDHRTYFGDKTVEPGGSSEGRYCPECRGPRTLVIYYAKDRSGRDERGVQCATCKTTWCIDAEMAHGLGLIPSDGRERDRAAFVGSGNSGPRFPEILARSAS